MQRTEPPKASIVIPCYNAQEWITQTVESALAQGEVVDRVIVVDDGSTDDSLSKLRAFKDAIILKTGPNRGRSQARNTGLALVETDYVHFLDADDVYEGPLVAQAVQKAVEAGVDIVLSGMEIRYNGRMVERKGPFGPPNQTEADVFANWFDGDWVGCMCVTWRTQYLRDIGGWDERNPVGEDGELITRAIMDGASIATNTKGLGIYNRGNQGSVSLGGGVTHDKLNGHIDLFEEIFDRARAAGLGHRLERSYAALYHIGRMSFLNGYPRLGRRAMRILKREGHYKSHGSVLHNFVCSLIGLEKKSKLFKS